MEREKKQKPMNLSDKRTAGGGGAGVSKESRCFTKHVLQSGCSYQGYEKLQL